MDADLLTRVRSDFENSIKGYSGAMQYRKGGLISEERAMQVYDACQQVRNSNRKFKSSQEFKRAVKATLIQDYGFSVALLLLIAKLVLLFVDLWFALDPVMRKVRMS